MDINDARRLGRAAGLQDAERFRLCPQDFEETDNPFGMDTESELYAAWTEAHEDEFEGNK